MEKLLPEQQEMSIGCDGFISRVLVTLRDIHEEEKGRKGKKRRENKSTLQAPLPTINRSVSHPDNRRSSQKHPSRVPSLPPLFATTDSQFSKRNLHSFSSSHGLTSAPRLGGSFVGKVHPSPDIAFKMDTSSSRRAQTLPVKTPMKNLFSEENVSLFANETVTEEKKRKKEEGEQDEPMFSLHAFDPPPSSNISHKIHPSKKEKNKVNYEKKFPIPVQDDSDGSKKKTEKRKKHDQTDEKTSKGGEYRVLQVDDSFIQEQAEESKQETAREESFSSTDPSPVEATVTATPKKKKITRVKKKEQVHVTIDEATEAPSVEPSELESTPIPSKKRAKRGNKVTAKDDASFGDDF